MAIIVHQGRLLSSGTIFVSGGWQNTYMAVCVGLCLPLFAFPFFDASSPDNPKRPITER